MYMFMAHYFDNLGYARHYTVAIDGPRWTFHGRYERATFRFGDAAYAATWEISNDGHTWRPLCRYSATRVSFGR